MLLIVANWIYIVILAFLTGHFTWHLLGSRLSKSDYFPHFSTVVIAGLMMLNSVSALISLFYNISWEVNIIFLLTAILYAVLKKNDLLLYLTRYLQDVKEVKPFLVFIYLLSIVFALLFSSAQSPYHDDGMYYIQTIRWIEQYGVVPGLGNLQLQLGFNTNWHVLSALFSWSFLGIENLHDTNALLYLLAVAYLLRGLQNIINGSGLISDFLKCLLIIPLFFFMRLLYAPSADLPAILLIWISFCQLIQYHETKQDKRLLLLPAVFCLYLVALKLSTLSVTIVVCFVFIKMLIEADYKSAVKLFLLGIIIIIPWLSRNVIITGYLLYPFEALDLFTFDWKMHPDAVKAEADWVTSYAVDPNIHPRQLEKMSLMEWIPIWFSRLALFNVAIILSAFLCLMTIVLSGLYGFVKQGKDYLGKNYIPLLIFSTCIVGLTLWLLKAPDPRFSYGFTFFLIFYGLAYIFVMARARITQVILQRVLSMAVFLITLLCLAVGYQHYHLFSKINFLYPAESKHTELELIELPGFQVYVPVNRLQCWDAPIPCSKSLDRRLRMRTTDISDGFRILYELPEGHF